MSTTWRSLTLLLGALALVAAACGDDDSAPATAAPAAGGEATTTTVADEMTTTAAQTGTVSLPDVDPLAVSGDIVTAGSSTVFPLAEAMAARFEDEGYVGQITIDSIGSGAGFERFCVSGESDISNASRPINDSEIEQCEAIGRTPIEFRVGTDALAVTVSTGNSFANDLTRDEIAVLFSTATTWQDVRAEFPANRIQRFVPGTDSGTFDYFVEEIFDEDEAPILAAGNTQLSEDDNVLVQGISGDGCDPSNASTTCAVGFFGYAYYSENEDVLKIVNVDGIEANTENVDNASYPLARPLYIYSTSTIMVERPQVADFINFFLTFVDEEVVPVGYFPAPASDLDGAKSAWLEAVGG